jgi:phosphoglycerol transferase MdoB-like AlkP superfamily enzyme
MRGLLTVWLWVLSLFLGANAIYFRHFGDLMPLSSVFSTESYNSFVWNSSIALMQLGDIVYLLMPIGLTAVWALLRHSPTERWTWRRSALCVLGSCATYLLCHAVLLWHETRYNKTLNTEWTYAETFRNNYMSAAMNEGSFCYKSKGVNFYVWSSIYYLFADPYIELTPEQSEQIRRYVNQRRNEAAPIIENRGKNLILIIVESLNAEHIGRKISGHDVTPTLSELIAADGTFSTLKMLPQVHDGRSSDGQALYNIGLLPISSGSTTCIYKKNEYPSLLHLLGYKNSISITADENNVWNHREAYEAYGYQRIHEDDSLRAAGIDQEAIGADLAVLTYAMQTLPRIQQPFMAQIVTLSMHAPCLDIDLFKNPKWLTEAKGLGELERRYLMTLHYFDHALGEFIASLKESGIYDNSVIVIASDHDQPLVEHVLPSEVAVKEPIAFIACNVGLTRQVDGVVGQVDAFPTLLDLMGCAASQWRGLGASMVSHPARGAVDFHGNVHGSVRSEAAVDSMRLEWTLSDRIVRSGFFGRVK